MATISATTNFNLALSPKQFKWVDTSDYVGQGIAPADVNGCIQNLITPSGVLYYNNTDFSNSGCDIRNGVSSNSQLTVPLPLVDGMPEAGTYTFTYKVYDSNLDVYYEQDYEFTYSYERPAISISQNCNCLAPLFSSTDATTYDISGATKSLVRTHTLYYPNGSAGAGSPEVSTDALIQTGNVYTPGTYTTTISAAVTYTFTDGLIVTDEFSGSREFYVDCEDVCAILCCLKGTQNQLDDLYVSNRAEYNALLPKFTSAMDYYVLATASASCGLSEDVSGYMTKIKTLLNCTDACCTDSDTPELVVGLGNTKIVVVQTPGSPLTTTVTVVGNVTTYTITFDPTLLAKINAAYNSIVASGTMITVSVVTNPDGSKTYTPNFTGSLSSTIAQSTTPFIVPTATGTKVTGCTAIAPATGNYLVLAEADYITTSVATVLNSGVSYRLLKNNVTPITNDRSFINSIVEAISAFDWLTTKMVVPAQVVALTVGDEVDFYVDALSDGGQIIGRSITLVRIS